MKRSSTDTPQPPDPVTSFKVTGRAREALELTTRLDGVREGVMAQETRRIVAELDRAILGQEARPGRIGMDPHPVCEPETAPPVGELVAVWPAWFSRLIH